MTEAKRNNMIVWGIILILAFVAFYFKRLGDRELRDGKCFIKTPCNCKK